MSNSVGTMPPARLIKLKPLAFAAIAAMAAYVLYHNERFLIDAAAPVWKHYEPFKWWLLPHGLAGACSLLLAPMQFTASHGWDDIRHQCFRPGTTRGVHSIS
jgi:hypothetical protein